MSTWTYITDVWFVVYFEYFETASYKLWVASSLKLKVTNYCCWNCKLRVVSLNLKLWVTDKNASVILKEQVTKFFCKLKCVLLETIANHIVNESLVIEIVAAKNTLHWKL